MTKRYGMEQPKPIDPESLGQVADADKTLRDWGKKIEFDLAEAIGAKKATVVFTDDVRHPHLEITIPGHQYTRIMFDPAEDPEKPFVVYPLHSKDEFYSEDAEKIWNGRYSKEALGKIIEDPDYFYGLSGDGTEKSS